jgi:hypothetical protein
VAAQAIAALAPYLTAAAPNGEDTLTFAELERQFKTLGAEVSNGVAAGKTEAAAARGTLQPESCSSFRLSTDAAQHGRGSARTRFSYSQPQSVEFRGRPPVHLVTLMARGRRASNGYVRLKKTLHGVA